ncbi:dTDP-glucose 4,6-dehydratase [Aeoliella mucimassa]|nr:dTDP-glucose 4,6-dehydratase [Aeoliella mucimassa]
MQTIIVTGGAGFIGSNFVRLVLESTDFQVVVLDKLTYAGNLGSLPLSDYPERLHFIRGCIGDAGLVADLLEKYTPTRVYNFAAESHVDRSIDAPDEFIKTNVLKTGVLLKQCLNFWESLEPEAKSAFRFLHVSTDEVYGSLGPTGLFTEQTQYQPNSPYSASKAASDHLVRAYHHTYGLPTIISNCSNNYGPYQFPEKLIPVIVLNAVEGKPLPIYGDGMNVRDWLFVTDHCKALQLLGEKGQPGEVYNIGGNAEKANIDVVKTICGVVDELCEGLAHSPCESLIEFVKDRPGHDRRYAIDASKISNELGWTPSVTFEEGIRQTVEWYLANSTWIEEVTSGEGRERIGLRTKQDGPVVHVPWTTPAEKYVDGPIEGIEPKSLKTFSDHRGWLIELFRNDELPTDNAPIMAYVSQTEPGVARGPHEHVDQADYFAFIGPGDFELWLWDSRPHSPTYGNRSVEVYGASNPTAVIVPAGVVHAYQNISDEPGWVFNGPNRLYAGPGKTEPVDEIRHENQEDSPYQLGQPKSNS